VNTRKNCLGPAKKGVRYRFFLKTVPDTFFCLCRLILLLLAAPARADDGPGLNLTDLAPYRASLQEKPGEPEAVAVTFRELWDHPGEYEGRRVRVEGQVKRRFRQAAFGTFPPLVESWAVSPAGDPFCLVYPAPEVKDDAAPGASVRFEGTFLRQINYHGADTERLAPLIVGARAPLVTSPAPPPPKEKEKAGPAPPGLAARDPLGWCLGLLVAVGVAFVLARQHLRAPFRRPLRGEPDEGPPEFVEPE
jgi:hypothetical protein